MAYGNLDAGSVLMYDIEHEGHDGELQPEEKHSTTEQGGTTPATHGVG